MKATTWMGAGLIALPLHLAWAEGQRPTPEQGSAVSEASAQVPSPSVAPALSGDPEAVGSPAAPAPVPRLRDSLRQSGDAAGEPFQPYRLSLEERQRMREQLRHHGTIEFRLKP